MYNRGFFYVFGDIKSIIVAHKTRCAFINFTTRTSAELAAEKVSEIGLELKGHSLKVVWARPKPQGNAKSEKPASKLSTMVYCYLMLDINISKNRTYRLKYYSTTCSSFNECKRKSQISQSKS
jgi:RNA recognition motif-containing protein